MVESKPKASTKEPDKLEAFPPIKTKAQRIRERFGFKTKEVQPEPEEKEFGPLRVPETLEAFPLPAFEPIERETRLGRFKAKLGERIRTTDFESIGGKFGRVVFEPKFIQRMKGPEVTRFSQWAAIVLLPFIIIMTFAINVVIFTLLQDILLGPDHGNQADIFGFMVILITFGAFCLSIWFWFLWVRTGGFKLFAY